MEDTVKNNHPVSPSSPFGDPRKQSTFLARLLFEATLHSAALLVTDGAPNSEQEVGRLLLCITCFFLLRLMEEQSGSTP